MRLLIPRAANKRLQRTRHERASLLSCVGEPLKRNVGQLHLMGMDAEKERLSKRRFLISLSIALLLVLYPFQTETVPAWTVQFVDEVGAPWKEVTVEEYWRNSPLEYRENRQSLLTDNNGYVRFPRRTTRAPLIVRLIGPLVNAVHVHGYHRTYVGLIPIGNFFASDSTQFYLPGDTLPSKMKLICHRQELCK